jgi:4'-phosphopantetheinyl transferase
MNVSDPEFHIPSTLELPDNEVQLWRLDLRALAANEDRWLALLSPDEQARASRFIPRQAREHFVVARGVLRTVLGACLATDPRKLVFQTSGKNKPSLGPPHDDSHVCFNVAHSGDVGLLAFVRRREVGVDVEHIRQDIEVEAIARRFFSSDEQKQLAAVSPVDKISAFFRCWTRKEAYIKAKGEGLSLPLDQFDVCLAPGSNKALLATRPDGSEAARWSLRDVVIGSGYTGALCVAGHDHRLRQWYLPNRAADWCDASVRRGYPRL